MVAGGVDRAAVEPRLRERVSSQAFAHIGRWLEAENTRLSRHASIWDLPELIRADMAQSEEGMLGTFGQHYRTTLPEALLLLDVPVDVALARLARRGDGTGELHERAETLEKLRQSYLAVAQRIRTRHPGVKVFVLDTSRAEVDDTLREAARALAIVGTP
jgi:hypothetical protein